MDKPPPVVRGADEVLLRMKHVGICGGDLAYFLDAGHAAGVTEAFVTCHEGLGTVIDGPSDLLGIDVVVDPLITCNSCTYCRGGRPQLCARRRDMGYGADGVAAEFVLAPLTRVHRLPAGIDPHAAVLAHGLAAVLHALAKEPIAAIRTALIFGCGPAGFMFALVLRSQGVHATIVGRSEPRLNLARGLGIAVQPLAKAPADGLLADLVIETTGARDVQELSVTKVRSGGDLLIYAPGSFRLDATDVFRREIRLRGTTGAFETIPSAIDLIADGTLPLQNLVTHCFPIAAGQEAFDLAVARPEDRGGFLKAVLCVS